MPNTLSPNKTILTFVLHQKNLRCTSVSGNIYALTEYEANEFTSGKINFESIFHVDDKDLAAIIFSEAIQDKPILLTYRVIQKNGKVKILRSVHEKSKSASNSDIYIKITIHDPIELKQDTVDSTVLTNFIAMMENTDDYIYFKDRNHVFTGASQTLVKVTHPAQHWSDLIGKTDYDVFSKEYADIYYELEKKVFSGKIKVAQEIQPTLDTQGNRGWVDNRKYPIKDKSGDIIGLFGIARDITRLVSAEDIAQQAQLSSAILNGIEDGVVTCDSNGKTTLINRAARDLCGFSSLQMSLSEWNHFVKLYDSKTGEPLTAEEHPLLRTLNEETVRNLEVCFETVRGKRRYTIINGNVLLSSENQRIGAIISIHDITEQILTERKRIESDAERNRLLKIIEEAGDFIGIADMEGNLLYSNLSARRMLGLPDDTSLSTLGIHQIHPDWAADLLVREGLPNVLRTGHWKGELAIRHSDGHEIPISQNLILHRNSDGNPEFISTIIRDISEIKNMMNLLKIEKDRAEKLGEAKTRFLSTMSHEIRTPLNGIIGMIRLLLETMKDAEINDSLNRILKTAEGLNIIINEILDYSRIESGKIHLENSEFKLSDVIDPILMLFEMNAKQKGISFEYKIDPQVPPALIGDSFRIRQILTNLVGNAIKFTQKGQVRLQVQLGHQSNGRAQIVFTVEDTGVGIDPVVLKSLTNPFVQADNSISRKFGGSGLGLYISKNLLKLMDSNIEITSQLGVGSTFQFTLNLNVGNNQHKKYSIKNSQVDTLKQVFNQLIPHLQGKHIMIVEDDLVNQTVISGYLKIAKIKFTVVDNGEDCVNLIHNSIDQFDGILMDVHMPILNGLEATEQIRKMNVKIPIIALTAGVTLDERRHCLDCGMDDVLMKPIDPVVLAKILNQYLV